MDALGLYREELLEHYKDPQNFGLLENFDATSRQLNPFCGDEIEIFVRWSNLGHSASSGHVQKISEIKFSGRGCAISIAAASMLTDFAKGKTKKELTSFGESDMLLLLGIEVSETRKKCALLALSVLKDCL